jgi:hypothetical protein
VTVRDVRQPPWKQKRPSQRAKKLTAKERHDARARARAAGRTYPNLVDNMAVLRTRNTPRKKTTGKKTAGRKTVRTKTAGKKTLGHKTAPQSSRARSKRR